MPKLIFLDSNQTLELEEGSVIYDALDTQGVSLPHGCLSGSCGACRIEVVQPESLMPAGMVEQDTINSLNFERESKNLPPLQIRLSCRAKILHDVSIKTIKD